MEILTFDVTLLSAHFQSQLNVRTASTASPLLRRQDSPAVIAPWENPKPARPIETKIAELRGLTNFIDLKAASVVNSGGDEDTQNLFAIFNALSSIRILAEYAAADKTPNSTLGRLDTRFQDGLAEIATFLQETAFARTDVLFGEASDKIESRASLGDTETDYIGARVHVGDRTTPLAGITGTETFTVTLSNSSNTDVINVDLSNISGPLNLDNIALEANKQIAAIVEADSSERYRTRLAVVEKDGGFALKVRGFATETATLTAPASPALIVAGTVTPTGADTLTNGFLTRLEDLATADPSQAPKVFVDALAPGQVPPEEPAEGEEAITSPPLLANSDALATAVDSTGATYVIGTTDGDLGGQFNGASTQDVFLRKYDSAGNLLFQRLLGAQEDASAFAIAVDASDNVVIAGRTAENLTAAAVIDSEDTFVTKYSSTGVELFTHQVQSAAVDGGLAVTFDAAGDIIVAGHISGQIDATATNQGGRDAFIRKLSGTDGTVVFSHQYGTTGTDEAVGVAIASDGNILVAAEENGRAVLRKFDATTPSTEIFSVDLGDLQGGGISGIAVSGTEIYLSGYSSNASVGGGSVAGAHSGGTDGFVVRLDDAGGSASAAYTAFVGSAGEDRVAEVVTDGTSVYVLGTTDSAIGSESQIGAKDSFVTKLDGATGARVWDHQLGTSLGGTAANGLAFSSQGSSVLTTLGLPQGQIDLSQDRTVTSQTSVRAGHSFYLSFNGGAPKKFTIQEGDTFRTLSTRINRLNFRFVEASSLFTIDDGDKLQIKAINGAEIDIISGPDGKDALIGLGLEPTKIIDDGTEEIDEETGDPINLKTFGLDLNQNLHLLGKKAAEFALVQIDNAIATIQSAYRKLNPDPLVEQLKARAKLTGGPVPARIASQLANYSAALARLS